MREFSQDSLTRAYGAASPASGRGEMKNDAAQPLPASGRGEVKPTGKMT